MGIRLAIGQFTALDAETAVFGRQLGIRSVQVNTPELPGDEYWSIADLERLRRDCEAEGYRLESIENIPLHFYGDVMTCGPRRDDQLECVARTVRNMGAAGINTLGYHFMPSLVWRTGLEPAGRGGARVTVFDSDHLGQGNHAKVPGTDIDHPLSNETIWASYATFLRSILPVAEAAGVVLALHPDDPPVRELGSSARLLADTRDFLRAEQLASGSPAWALNLCLGSISEMPGGAINVHDMIKEFVPRGKVRCVHFRDVIGSVPRFQECFLGEGNFDPLAVMTHLRSSGFDGFILDDHVPEIVNDTLWGHRSRAYALGYLQALLDVTRT